MKKHYEMDTLTFTLRGETTVIITGTNEYGISVLVAQYDFNDNGYKFYNDLQGKEVEVSRVGTILNYLFKNGMTWWSDKEIETAKKNWATIKKSKEKEHKAFLKERDEQQAQYFIEALERLEDTHTRIATSVAHHSDEALTDIVQRSYKRASKKTVQKVCKAIQGYNEGQ